MTWNKISLWVQLCFDIVVYPKDIDNSLAHKLANMTLSASAILSSSSLIQCWRSFLLITELQMQSILILFFVCRVEKLSVFTTPLEIMLPRHYVQALHITRYNHLCQFFLSRFVDLMLLTIYLVKMGSQSFGVRCRISLPIFLVFHDYCRRSLKYILLLLQFEIFSALRRKVSHQAGYFLAYVGPMNFINKAPGASIFKQRTEAQHS